MKITNDHLSFQSKIKFVSEPQFKKTLLMQPVKAQFVPYPWTIETLQHNCRNIYTSKLTNCIAGFMQNSEKENLMFHLATRNKQEAQDENVEEFNIENIERELMQFYNFEDKSLHAIILGGLKSVNEKLDNSKYLKMIINLFDKYNVQYSVLGPRKDIPYRGFGDFSMLYTQDDDTLYVTNSATESMCGREYEIDVKDDGIIYNEYEPVEDYKAIDTMVSGTNKKRVKAGAEDFFKSRFEEVKLCSLDEFV